MTPQGKADAVRRLKRRGLRVAVVGDGINDSMAFTLADVAVAMGNGSDIGSTILAAANGLRPLNRRPASGSPPPV